METKQEAIREFVAQALEQKKRDSCYNGNLLHRSRLTREVLWNQTIT
jgi:hypothetical protein